MSGLTLSNLVDDAAFLSYEHQLQLADVVGEHRVEIDLEAGRFMFVGDQTFVCQRFHLLGSAAPGPRSWLWSWANPAGYSPQLTGLATSVRDFGGQHGVGELSGGEVSFDVLPGRPDQYGAVTLFSDAAKAVTGVWTSYNVEAGGGTRVAFLIEHPSFALPPATGPRVARVLSEGIANLPLTEHRRALHTYAVKRGLNPAWSPSWAQLTVTGPGLSATVAFDSYGRARDVTAKPAG